MKSILKSLALFLVPLLFTHCGTSSKISQEQQIATAWEAGEFQTVYDISTSVIKKAEEKRKVSSPEMLQYAGEAAIKLQKNDDARKYLEQAMNAAPTMESLYPILVDLYDRIDNLSYLITTLENYNKRFPEGQFKQELNIKAFNAYSKSENWELAYNSWANLTEADKENPQLLETYLSVCEKLNKTEELQQVVIQLLEIEPKNISALRIKATNLYQSAEGRYQKEMKAYNSNKTRKQYALLLKGLDKSTAEFKDARDIFEFIYKENPSGEVASFLGNIYARLNNKAKSTFYKKLSK